MHTLNAGDSSEEILQRLLKRSEEKWGEERTQEIRATLKSAARQLSEVSSNLPDKETEPGFYQ